jgi:hypothetical protein
VVKIFFFAKVHCHDPLGVWQKYRNALSLATGIGISAFRSGATPSRAIKFYNDFIVKTFLTGEKTETQNGTHNISRW